MTESNRRHPACKAGALPTELITLCEVLRFAACVAVSAKTCIKTQLIVSGKAQAVKKVKIIEYGCSGNALRVVFIEEMKICIYFWVGRLFSGKLAAIE